MSIPSIHGPKFNSYAYSEKIPGAGIKEFFTGKKEPLNVLYIQGLDDSFGKTKKLSREHFDESIRSGEIKINDLDGATPHDKLKTLENTLLALRQKGRINNATQIILSCQPGENAGELSIGCDGNKGAWKIKDTIDAVRGGRTEGQLQSSSDFDGVIHIFGHSPEEFSLENRKKFGNVLMHASGKFNWSHHHAFMIGHIARASRNIKNEAPEKITRQVRDALQPYAGYPIYRISNEKVKIKYPTFRNQSPERISFYVNSIKNHKKPIDMLISSVERDSPETLAIRLKTGDLSGRLKDKKHDLASFEILKARLLGAVVCSKKDQEAKLKLLTDELGIDFHGIDPKSWIGTSLQAEITRNLDRLDPALLSFLHKLKFEAIFRNDQYYLNFIEKKITEGRLPELIQKFPKILTDRLKELDCRQVLQLTNAAHRSPDCKATIGLLRHCGLNFSLLTKDQLQDLIKQFMEAPSPYVRLVDGLVQNGATSIIEILGENKKAKFLYNFLSSGTKNQEKIREKLTEEITDKKDRVKDLVQEAFDEAIHFENFNPIKFLIACGLQPDFRIDDEYTVLHQACKHFSDNPSAVLEIIKLFSDVEANLHVRSRYEFTPIDLILQNKKYDSQQAEKILRIFMQHDQSMFDTSDADGLKLVHRAARLSNPVFLEALLKIRPKYINKASSEQLFTPLHVAIIQANDDQKSGQFKKAEFLEVVKILLKNNADLDAKDIYGHSPKEYLAGLKGFEDLNLEKWKAELSTTADAIAV
ncbi:MAG: ankyrin repeat domain-containing protein [Oxalobacteraceae bacterium]|nr:ankyrin repeat domain-containing protein [Oxalobacteraceae bacterium]